MGSFGIVLKGIQKNGQHETTFAVKMPHLNTRKSQEHYKYALKLLVNEYNILKQLNEIDNQSTRLLDKNWPTVTNPMQVSLFASMSYFILKDVGDRVKEAYSKLVSDIKKDKFIKKLRLDILKALFHAHEKHICHCDLRLDNIMVILKENKEYYFQLIDWGLARSIGSYMHKHTGGIDFFHDEIVETTKEKQIYIKVRKEHDLASFLYDMIVLKSLSYGDYTASWLDQSRNLIKVERQKYLISQNCNYDDEMKKLIQYI